MGHVQFWALHLPHSDFGHLARASAIPAWVGWCGFLSLPITHLGGSFGSAVDGVVESLFEVVGLAGHDARPRRRARAFADANAIRVMCARMA